MSLRHVEAKDFPERIATHRDSWFKSSYNMDTYLRLRNIDIYDPELDIVAVSEDGTFGSYCIGWIDEQLSVGSFEPVGTRPAFRRQGLGQQVNYEGLRRMKRKGMSNAAIGTAGFNDRAFGLYSTCGFDLVDKNRTFIKSDT
jgi:ribosomal protein S18 acetylase RimI-like enzyme